MKTVLATAIAMMVIGGSWSHGAERHQLTSVGDGKIRVLDANAESGTSRAVIVEGKPLAHTIQLVPIDGDGDLIGGKDVSKQTDAVLENLRVAIGDIGSSLDQVVKLNLYVAAESDVPAVRKIVASKFTGALKPAVSLVLTRLPAPSAEEQALVAADAVVIAPAKAPSGVSGSGLLAVLPPGPRIYVSGQAEPGDLATATLKTLQSLEATLKLFGRSKRDIVQLKMFLKPMADIEEANAVVDEFFPNKPIPPTVWVEWESNLPIEIELVAVGGPDDTGVATGGGVEYITPPGMTASPIFSRVAYVRHPQSIYISGLYGGEGSGASQVERIFTDLTETLTATGSDLKHLVKATYYVSNDEASKKLNELRPNYYAAHRPPAASKAVVSGVGLPGRTITIDMIAVPKD